MLQSKLFDPRFRSRKEISALVRRRAEIFFVQQVYNRIIRLSPRSEDAYSTHLPVLCAIAGIIQPTRIIEFGSGLISTTTFLDRNIFPKLTSLLSFENSRDWYGTVASQIGDDARLQYRFVDGSMGDAVSSDDVSTADLIFIDDEDSLPPPLLRRADTIAAVAARRPAGIPIVIHDIELRHLHRSAMSFDHVFRFDALHPQTGVAWNGRWELADRLPTINRVIRKYSATMPHRCVEQWSTVFCEVLKPAQPPS